MRDDSHKQRPTRRRDRTDALGRDDGRRPRNRAAVAPMSRISTRGDGVPTPGMRDYYAQYAHGGFAAVVTEGVYTAGPASQS
jgi:2,4-dienoyl-CoA reductase-like NADH-dependent reductase (Old Yellow Enzyme family)